MLHRRRILAQLRYFRALVRRFRVTLVLTLLLFVGAPLAFRALYIAPGGARISLGEAVHHVYFLLFGQPSLPYVDIGLVELMNLVIPPFGIAVVVDGIVRFAYLFFAKRRSDREWIAVISESLEGHVIVCGAGRIGYRVALQLLALGKEVIVIDKNEEAPFVGVLRDLKVPVLIDNIRSPGCLGRTNARRASAIVCATDDDLANMNVALDSRRENPAIRVVMRLFDDDLLAKVKETFKAEALSSSALAAPAMALSALDPRIVHSFQMGRHLMVVSQFVAKDGLPGLTVSNLRDRFGSFTLDYVPPNGAEILHPPGSTTIAPGDALTIQAAYADYLKLRAFTNEATPPTSLA